MDSLDEVAQAVRGCTDCPLHRGRTNAVPGEGSPSAELNVIGEGQGSTKTARGAHRRPGRATAGGPAGHHRHQPNDVFIANGEVPPADNVTPSVGNRRLQQVPGTADRLKPEADRNTRKVSLGRLHPWGERYPGTGKLRHKDGPLPVLDPQPPLRERTAKDAGGRLQGNLRTTRV